MKYLLDTHLLLWAATGSARLPTEARRIIDLPETEPVVSAASLWEIAIKSGLGRTDFRIDLRLLRRRLSVHGYTELPVTGTHAAEVCLLPPIHRDPFDRMLVAQARVEGVTLLTTDSIVARYPGPIRAL